MSTASTFEVVADEAGPVCPDDWDILVPDDQNTCFIDPFTSAVEVYAANPSLVADNCSDPADILMTMTEELTPAPNCPDGIFFSSRSVTRVYSFTDACGNESESCPQIITYEFNSCQSLTSFGLVAVGGSTSVNVPSGCDLPTIEVVEAEQGVCGYVEYMWLVTTQEGPNGNPIIPTSLNLGTVWNIIDGENEPTLDPGVIAENTYYVRCARNFSCCIFGESNIVSFIIDDAATCPLVQTGEVQQVEDCENTITLRSPTDDFLSAEQMRFITNLNATLNNKTGSSSNLTIDAKQGIEGLPGLEVYQGGGLELYLEGCKED